MSENESKRMKNDTASKSLMPEDVIEYLNKGMIDGFEYDILGLNRKNINDSMMPELCEWIVKLGDKVRALSLGENQSTSVGASMLFDILKTSNSSLKSISLYHNQQIDDKCMKSLGEYIKSNKSIEMISLGHTSISDTGIKILAPYLDDNTTFKQLDFSGNKRITDKSIPLLMKMIESSCIEEMHITGPLTTQWNIIHVLSVCNRIKNGSTSLKLSNIGLNDDDLIKICDAMKKYGIDKLKEIHLEINEITSKGASVLIDTLKECNSVVSKLDLSDNQLDDECMKQLGEYLQDNEHIEILRLGSNKITDKGIEILSEYLIGNTTLRELYLHGNKGITDTSVPNLIGLVNKSCITSIASWNTSISEEKQQETQAALSIPSEKREIPIKSNTKSAAKISASTST